MRAVYVEFEADPFVFEIRSAGESRKKDVVFDVYGIEDASSLQVRVQPIPPAGSFRFEAGPAMVRRPSDHPSNPVRVRIPVLCSGGEDGREEETTLTLTLEYPGQEPETRSVRLVGSANCVLPLWRVLAEEYAELRETWRDEIRGNKVLQDPQATDRRKLQEVLGIAHARTKQGDGLAALCFSGGGIRSATFNLGTLQALAAAGVLDKFDYVSSVSGGGYLSSWLAGWIHRAGGISVVAPQLAGAQADPERPEPGPLRALRQYSNYLTPRLGALSADTWSVGAIVFRNLLLNLLVMLPLLAAVLAVPLLAVARIPESWSPGPVPLFWLSVALGTLGLFFMSLLRASAKPRPGRDPGGWDQQFLGLVLVPLLLSTALMAWAVAEFAARYDLEFWGALRWIVIWSLVSPVVAFALAILLQGRMMHRERSSFQGDLLALLLSGSIVTLIYAAILGNWAEPLLESPYPLYPMLAPILYLGPVLLGKTLFIAFSSVAEEAGYPSDLGEADREWWARWSGCVLIAAVLWMVFSATVLFGPFLLGLARNEIGSRITTAGITGVLGWIISRLGQSPGTSAKEGGSSGGWRSWALALAAPLFCLALLLLVSAVTQDLLRAIFAQPTNYDERWVPPFQGHIWQVLAAIAVFGLLGLAMGRFVNVNRFSLQAMYRNRLVRAYLGASNTDRRPNLFTGFDPEDNLRMHELRANRPFPVVNMALNLVAGKDLAWQQRKSECFTSSPLHSGAARLGYRRSQAYGGEQGISLGTAVATSGAAANPNMGYHSSPAITFIMTLFNARLGVWLGNPGPLGVDTYTRSGPRSSALVLMSEALGQTDSENPYVNLSDGGHFENLGIYEMVRRRCRYIVACDAGGDPECAFEDLGNAIRKIRIDFGIPVDFENRVRIYSKSAVKPDARYCAIGTIRYSAVDGAGVEDGTLIYLKPAIYESPYEPYDVYNYSRSSSDFPHESTADQWFSESQFESYRTLGQGTVGAMIGWNARERMPQLRSLEDLAERVREYLQTQPSAPAERLPGPGGNGQETVPPPAAPDPLAAS
ncbi:MAG TPA: hypothetical protein VN493_31230 [Thermoanaerobaculia bacterium]|nr:hypothetical protein [Thermoanaerobaculia bacterium]